MAESESTFVRMAGRCISAVASRILSLDALIRAKEAMGGPKGKLTILQLKAIQERTQTH